MDDLEIEKRLLRYAANPLMAVDTEVYDQAGHALARYRDRIEAADKEIGNLRAALAANAERLEEMARHIVKLSKERPMSYDLLEDLRETAQTLNSTAWRRRDGGQEWTIIAIKLENAADRIEAQNKRIAELEAALAAAREICEKALRRPVGWRTPQAQDEVEKIVASILGALAAAKEPI